MKIRTVKSMLAAALMLVFPATVLAGGLDNVRINGFASQGYIKSESNNFLLTDSEEGSYQLNEVGLTVNAPVDDKLRVGFQLLSRDFGTEGNHQVKLDWGYGDYHVNDAFGLRFGKIKLPIGLYNEERDSDIVRAMAYLPQGIYDEARRDFMVAGLGMGIYGNIAVGAGDIEYQLFAGETNVSDEITLVKRQKSAINSEINNALSGMALPSLSPDQLVSDLEWNSDATTVSRVIYNTPFSGLRLGASFSEVSGSFDGYNVGGVDIADVKAGYYDMSTYSVEYANDYLTVSGETQKYHYKTEIGHYDNPVVTNFGVPIETVSDDTDQEAWYVLASLRIPGAEEFTVSVVYDEYYNNADSKDNPSNYRKDSGLGLRWDVTPNFVVKAEHHTVEGTADLNIYNDGGTDTDWGYSIFKTSFVF